METKQYFLPGDLVTIKHDLPDKPLMLVTEIVDVVQPQKTVKAIRCVWFTVTSELQTYVFSIKDLVKI